MESAATRPDITANGAPVKEVSGMNLRGRVEIVIDMTDYVGPTPPKVDALSLIGVKKATVELFDGKDVVKTVTSDGSEITFPESPRATRVVISVEDENATATLVLKACYKRRGKAQNVN